MKRILYKINGARDMILQDGWVAFLRHLARDFLGFPPERNYLYRHTIIARNVEDFLPRLQDFEDFMLRDRRELEELENKGYNFGSRRSNTNIALNNEAVVFCVFVEKELVHTGRVALTENGKRYVDNRPFKVNFKQGEACTGNTWTSPKARSQGLMKYGYFRRFEFLRELGITTSLNSVETTNIASQRVHAKFEPEIYAEAKLRKFLFLFESWKETPINHNQ